MKKKCKGKLFIILIIAGVLLITVLPSMCGERKDSNGQNVVNGPYVVSEEVYDAFKKTVSEHTVATFELEGFKVTVTDISFWMIEPKGAFCYPTRPDIGILIDEYLYELYLAGDVNALFVLNHELGHMTLHYGIERGSEVFSQGDPILIAQYNKNQIDADVWAVRRMGLSFEEYEAIRKWMAHVYNKDLRTKVSIATYEKYRAENPKRTLKTYGTLQQYLDDQNVKWKEFEDRFSGLDAERIAEVGKQIR
ncbi:hypothetical protein FACS1894137_05600 [Spirochaetia bacterium]|nr:hypothetical protein FACS1894137_05600 [Spirochaetia bacterium]